MIHDHTLTQAAQSGDHRAADQLVRRHAGIAYRIAADFYLPGADRDDTRQEALIGLYLAVTCFRPDRGATFTTFANHCIRMRLYQAVKLADRGKHRPLTNALRVVQLDDGETDATELAVDHRADPALIVAQRADLRTLALGTRTLSALERVSLLGIANGHTYNQLATTTGTSTKSIDNACQRARVKLRALLEAAA